MKKLLLSLIFLIFLSTAVYPVAIGVSPETREICMGPQEIAETSFFPSTNSEVPLELDVQITSTIDIQGNTTLILKPMDITEYRVFINRPPAGLYSSDIYFCANSEIDGQEVKKCIKSKIITNVTTACSIDTEIYTSIIENKLFIQISLAILVILSIIFLISNSSKRTRKRQKAKKK
jgi:hypothetical protein